MPKVRERLFADLRRAQPSDTAGIGASTTTSHDERKPGHRIEGPGRWKTMTLTPHEFIRRFLMHVLPKGFHRIRH
jgi:Putative transposase